MGIEYHSSADESNEHKKKKLPPEAKTNARPNAKEKPNQYETIPEAPTVTRQILLSAPYKVYKDIIDADSKTNGIQKTEVPAVFSIMESEFGGQFVQVSNGKESFWINTKEAKPQDWSVHMGYLTSDLVGSNILRLSSKPFSDDNDVSLDIPVAPNTFYPAFEEGSGKNGEKGTYRIGMDFEGKTKELKQGTLWTQERNSEDKVIGQLAYLITEKDLKKFSVNLKGFIEAMALLSPTERNSSDRILDTIGPMYLQLLGINARSPEEAAKAVKYAGKRGFSPQNLHLTLDDISRMDDQAFKQWLHLSTICQKKCDELLAGTNKKMEKTISIDGKETRCFILPINQLP